MAALDVVRADRAELAETFRDLSDEIEGLMAGRPYPETDPRLPAAADRHARREAAADRPHRRRVGGGVALRRPLRPRRPQAP